MDSTEILHQLLTTTARVEAAVEMLSARTKELVESNKSLEERVRKLETWAAAKGALWGTGMGFLASLGVSVVSRYWIGK